MERLTYRDCAGVACFRWENPRGTAVIANEAISRLAAYEDTGLTPEEIRSVFNEDAVLKLAAQALGIAQGAFDEALKYSKQRVQFNQPISSFQAVQHILADMAIQIEAARALIYQTCRYIDSGAKEFSKEAAMCKVFASDIAMKVTTDAVQVLGGYGYMKEYPVEKRMRDAKITQIYEGTNQIQRNVIALELIKQSSRK